MTGARRPFAVVVVLLLFVAALPATAWSQSSGRATGPIPPDVLTRVIGSLTDDVKVPDPPAGRAPRLTNERVLAIAGRSREVRDWIADHPVTRTTPEFKENDGKHIVWYVRKKADGGEVTEAQVWVDDATGRITETRVGPQVAWMMARGVPGAFGRAVTRPAIWLTLCALFLVPLLDVRRLVSWRTLDLLVLLSFGVSLVWFNRGEIFTSVPLAYPPMLYLLGRLVWIAVRRVRAPGVQPGMVDEDGAPARPRFRGWAPTWLLVTCLLVSLGLRYGLNAFDSNVIDVGYAGVIGADRIGHGQTPYGTFPADCGRCDTYGPLAYLTYVPFELGAPYTGQWNSLPAAHGAAVAFDLLCIAGLALLGNRLGGRRLAAALALAWAAYPFTAYALESNSNDALVSATLIWMLVLAANPVSRGLALALSIATKFSPAILVPVMWRSPFPRPRSTDRGLAGSLRFAGGLAAGAVLTGWVLLLDGDDGLRAFWSRTIQYQFDRDSPFSIWGQHPGLRPVQLALTAAVALGALALWRWPRRRDLLTATALAGAVLIATQLTLTHWFYLYIPWFAPFVLIATVPAWPAMVAPRVAAAPTPPEPAAAAAGDAP